MMFDDDSGRFTCENDGLLFVWDEKPNENVSDLVNMLTKNYYSHIDDIVQFMIADLQQMYGEVDAEIIKEKLGKPIIDYDNGIVTYLEQSFDNVHIFEFGFLDDAFEELQYFSVDG
ncbi:MAG: hypothetical protein IJ079_07700 [Lachnospiraceae bacterium]|nr:hypothetical protein [Lachnospiraceae bacterium]